MEEFQQTEETMDIYLSIDETAPKTLWKARPSCCGNELPEPGTPCPSCGSTAYPVLSAGKLTIKAAGQELVAKDDWCYDLNKEVKLERLIDKPRADGTHDRYHERFTDTDTQRVIHECKEPLSEHRNRGSAKHKYGENLESR